MYDAQGNGRYQSEASYNAETAKAYGYILLDERLIEVPGVQRSRFEICDLLDIEKKKFIHIKKSSRRSSVLSHFFKQGAHSAQQFCRFPAAWTQLKEAVQETCDGKTAQRLLQAFNEHERKWTVEFIIADTPRMDGDFNIPFFSKISLRDEAIGLKAMNYLVALRFIRLEPESV